MVCFVPNPLLYVYEWLLTQEKKKHEHALHQDTVFMPAGLTVHSTTHISYGADTQFKMLWFRKGKEICCLQNGCIGQTVNVT